MMKKLLINICLSGIAVICADSCIRDKIEPCPPLSVWVEVTDKNYFNVNDIIWEKPVDENLPFRKYISSLQYSLKDALTGDVAAQGEVSVIESDGKSFHIGFCDCIPHGKYILTVYAAGAGDNQPMAFDESGESLLLHPENEEGGDVFLTSDTLIYDAWNYEYKVGLERAKGKLLVLFENLPSECAGIRHFINDLYETVTPDFDYEGFSFVKKSFLPDAADKESLMTETLLSPSANGGESDYSLVLSGTDGTALPDPENKAVKIKMKRNELTLLRYSYGAGGKLVISIFVNDHWEEVHGLEID